MSQRTEFPFNETAPRHLGNGEIQQRLVTFSDDEVKPTKRENVKSNFFEALVRKKNSHFFVDSPFVLWGMTDWFINVVIFYFLDSGTFSITAGF